MNTAKFGTCPTVGFRLSPLCFSTIHHSSPPSVLTTTTTTMTELAVRERDMVEREQ
ncbi:hypothetical protein L195_g029550 [Trifolium pratense]|uniref:Uncharacterized protein n=1 Tax=Trifolium pratense TaxID=57577 RepID=A0A2K3L543_TRIPR|nr:hypothetical protein L195_g029550 [Trifolium pratense]